ncbi:MAG TPA: AMIN domain-containing protein [Methylomirabilota bacterium]|nr:AMIN domain-containing protein [Methylomirabilota bacterium]
MKAQTPTLRSLRPLGRLLRLWGLLVLASLLGASIGIAQMPDAPVQLKSISVDRQGDGVTVLVSMSGPAKYAASFIDSPNRLVVDMQGTTFAWNRTALKSDGDPVREVRGSQFRVGTARVVVELSRKVGYRIDERPEGLALVLEPGATAQADRPAPRAKETTKAPATIPASTKIAPQKVDAQRVTEAFEALKIDLRPAAPKAEPVVAAAPLGTPELRSAETRMPEDKTSEARMPAVRMPEVRAPEVRAPEVRAKDALVKPVTLAPIALVPVPAQATPAPPPASPPTTQPPTGNGQRLISLDFKDADVVNLLRILAAESGRNIVAGDDVKGKVSVSLRNVTWEQALDTILETRGLQKIERGSVIRIVSTEQLTKEREALARVQEAQVKSESEIRTKRAEAEVKEAEASTKKLQAEAAISEAKARGPLREELIRLSYADPEDVARTLQGILGIPPSGAPIQQIPIISAIPQNPTTVPSSGLPPNPLLRPFPEVNAPVPPYMAAPGQQVISASQDVLAKGITIQAHKPTNSVFIRHYEADLERLKKLIKEQLDIPLPQVKIEARMEILDRSAFEGIGVQWGGAGAGNINNTTTLIGQGFQSAPGKNAGTTSPAFSGILLPDGTIAPFNPVAPININPANPNLTLSQLFPISATTGLPLGGNVVNLPFGGLPNASNAGVPAGGISFGFVSNNFNINLALQALASQGKTRTLARPEIVTVENNKAAVSLGEEIPYATVSSAGTQIQFKEAVLKLEVTPTVLREKVGDKTITKIKMIVVVENNSRGDTITPAAGVAVPIINRRKAETQVLIKEGDRLVIGGVTQGTVSTTVRKVPLFGDIPIFGWLFKQKENNETGRELVVFVTPSIVQQNGAGMAMTPVAPR